MTRFDGTAARQLNLIDDEPEPKAATDPQPPRHGGRNLRLLQKDIYAELTRRRRRAQIAARHRLDEE